MVQRYADVTVQLPVLQAARSALAQGSLQLVLLSSAFSFQPSRASEIIQSTEAYHIAKLI